jgi:transposase-like protein
MKYDKTVNIVLKLRCPYCNGSMDSFESSILINRKTCHECGKQFAILWKAETQKDM